MLTQDGNTARPVQDVPPELLKLAEKLRKAAGPLEPIADADAHMRALIADDPVMQEYIAKADAGQLPPGIVIDLERIRRRRETYRAVVAYRERQWAVFPIVENGKTPLPGSRGFYDATCDIDQTDAWFAGDEGPAYNIGFLPESAGLCVIDVDPGAEPLELPAGPRARTPRGGSHHYLAGSLPGTQSKIADHVDSRGRSSYVLLPPSYVIDPEKGIDGAYKWQCEAPFDSWECPVIPDWIVEACKPTVEEHRTAGDYVEDKPEAIRQGALWLELQERPVEFAGSDGQCYEAAARLMDFGLSDETILVMMQNWSGFDTDWLWEKIAHAAGYRQNGRGADTPTSTAEAFKQFAETVAAAQPANDDAAAWPSARSDAAPRRRFKGYSPLEGDRLADLTYHDRHKLLPRVPGGCHGTIVGKKGSQKSGIALKFGIDAVVENDERVLYIAGEGGHGIAHIRLRKHCEARGLALADLEGKWITVPNSPNITNPDDVDELVAEYREFDPDIIFVDTLTRATAGIDINSPQAGSAVTEGAIRLAEAFDATVALIGHPRKEGGDVTLGSTLVPDHAYFNWTVEFDKGGNIVTVHLRNMKDGPDDFDVHFKRIMVNAVPAIVDCNRNEKPARKTKPVSSRELDKQIWRRGVADAIREQWEDGNRDHPTVPSLAEIMMRDENDEERDNKRESIMRRLERGVRDALRDLAVCDRHGKPVSNPVRFKRWPDIEHLGIATPGVGD